MPERLSRTEITEALAGLPGWSLTEGREAFAKRFVFAEMGYASWARAATDAP
jgi:pterin-4a-carbinolamine dehydratase